MFDSLAVALPPGIGMENPMTDYEAYRGPALTDHQSSPPQALSFRKGTRLLWRHKAIILISMAVGLSIAFLVRSQTIPRYEAEAQIVLDVRNTTIMKFDTVVSGLLPQPEVIHTEMDIIASRGMAERVLYHLPPGDVKQLGDDGAKATPMSRFFTETWPEILNQLVEWMPLLKQTAQSFHRSRRYRRPASLLRRVRRIAAIWSPSSCRASRSAMTGDPTQSTSPSHRPTLISRQPSPTLMQGNIWRTRST